MPQINSLPDLRSAGIESKEYEEARKVHQRVLAKQYELENEQVALEAELARKEGADMRDLAERWLAGEDDVEEAEELGELRAKVASLKRRKQALRDVALPEAEARVLNVVQRYRQEWAAKIEREELPVRIEELRALLPQVQQLVGPKAYRLLSALRVLEWAEGSNPGVYSPPQDQLTPSTVRGVEEFLSRVDSRREERAQVRHFEELDREVTA
jgi:hypothetical protein